MSATQFAFILFPIFLIFTSCTGSRDREAGGIIEGKIYVTGNGPFTHLAVEEAGGEVYVLSSSREAQEELLKLQGMPAPLHWSQIIRGEKEKSPTVRRFKLVAIEGQSIK